MLLGGQRQAPRALEVDDDQPLIMIGTEVQRDDRPAAGDAVGLQAMRLLIFLDHVRQRRVELDARRQPETLAQHADAIALRSELQRRSRRNLELGKVAPALLVADQATAQVGVNRVDRQEQIIGRAGPFLERDLVERDVVVAQLGRDLGVDIDHVDALLDARRQVDRLDRLLALGQRRSRNSERGDGEQQAKSFKRTLVHARRLSMET